MSQILCSIPLILICASYQDINEPWHHSQEYEVKNLVITLLQEQPSETQVLLGKQIYKFSLHT